MREDHLHLISGGAAPHSSLTNRLTALASVYRHTSIVSVLALTLRLAHTRVAGARGTVQNISQWPTAAPSVWAGREASLTARVTANSPSTPMGLGDVLVYAFCAFIVGVFIFNLVDTAQTAKRKIAAKKHD